MNSVLRHMALRLWLTAMAGGMLCLALLPGWQRVMGIQWLSVPSLLVLAVCFAALGWAMNRMGMIQLRRHLKEASVWDRAGMLSEADAAFHKAVALFDSFWLSPGLRRKRSAWFQGLLARFYLGPAKADAHARTLVAEYLIRHPRDADVAEQWLEQLPVYSDHLPVEHDAAARVGDAMAADMTVQRRLMQFFLAAGRSDFHARQTCRRVWMSGHSVPDDLICPLARMLVEAAVISPWALQVYLKAHAAGEAGVLEGLAACVRWMTPTHETRGDLAAADAALGAAQHGGIDRLSARFAPPREAAKPLRPPFSIGPLPRLRLPAITPLMKWLGASGQRVVTAAGPVLTGANAARVAAVVALVGVMGTGAWYLFKPRPPAPVEVPVAAPAPVITDPFTIQVAAYLQAGDAQRFVDRLTEKGLDAFWTRAASANRTWYQVKVSHFATKAEAQAYGQAMKSKGVIDDFYVANYDPTPPKGNKAP